MQKSLINAVIIICLITSISAQTLAQTTIGGLVKDRNGAVIVGARIFLLNLQTRMEKVAVTNSGGVFSSDKVTPGNYQIRVAAQGFAGQITPVRATDGGIADLEITLAVGVSNLTVTAEIGRSEQLRNVPQPVSVVTSEEISERSPTVLSQVGKNRSRFECANDESDHRRGGRSAV